MEIRIALIDNPNSPREISESEWRRPFEMRRQVVVLANEGDILGVLMRDAMDEFGIGSLDDGSVYPVFIAWITHRDPVDPVLRTTLDLQLAAGNRGR
jgi:hypothetical protein